MLELQYFKSQVVTTVLDRLLRSTVPEPGLYTISLNRDARIPTDCDYYPMPESTMMNVASFYDTARSIMDSGPTWATCVVRPQWAISYKLGSADTPTITGYFSELVDGNGNTLEELSGIFAAAYDQHVLINRCITFCFEYPVAFAQQKPTLAWAQLKREQISGCTLLHINLLPHPNGLGGWQTIGRAMSQERGSEYGDQLPAHLFGRNLRGTPVENTPYAGKIPWQSSSHQMLSLLVGSPTYLPLPDVSRFPSPPLSQDPGDYDTETV